MSHCVWQHAFALLLSTHHLMRGHRRVRKTEQKNERGREREREREGGGHQWDKQANSRRRTRKRERRRKGEKVRRGYRMGGGGECTHAHVFTQMRAHAHVGANVRAHTHTCARTHTRARAHSHIRTRKWENGGLTDSESLLFIDNFAVSEADNKCRTLSSGFSYVSTFWAKSGLKEMVVELVFEPFSLLLYQGLVFETFL